jgi:hypothetical protein
MVLGLGAFGLAVVGSRSGKLKPKGFPANSTTEDKQASESPRPARVAPEPVATSPGIGVEVATPSVAAVPSESERVELARQLVKNLSEIHLQGELTPEKADEWQRHLEELVEQSKAVVPVLQEFFQRNEDLRFDSGSGTNLLGYPTLRIAFLKVLFDVPAPENVDLEQQVLRTTTDPDEIALLARQLELQEPGKYGELIVQTAKVALEGARNGQWPGRDAGPLAKILEQYGGTEVK